MEDDTGLFLEKEELHGFVKDEADELKSPEFEVEGLPPEAETNASLSCFGPVKETDANTHTTKKPSAAKDRHQALCLQRNLNYLEKIHEERDLFIQKTRAELGACRQRMDLIARQQETVAAATALEKGAGSTSAAVGRLRAVSSRLCTELDNERQLESKIRSTLKDSEKDMWHIEIEEGKLDVILKSLQEKAAPTGNCLEAQPGQQLYREKAASRKVERSRLLRLRKSVRTQKEHGLRHQELLEEAQKSHKVALRFLKASLGRIRERERKEEVEWRRQLQRRVDAVLALRNSVIANRETLRKFQAWGQARAKLVEQKAQAEKEEILAQGGDAFKHLSHQRRRQELEAQKRAAEEEQKLRRREIVARILKEEAEEENRKKKQLSTTKTRARLTLRDKTWRYISDFCEGVSTAVTPGYSLLLFFL